MKNTKPTRKQKRIKSKTSRLVVNRIRTLRILSKTTQEGFAKKARMSYKYYQALEAGRKKDMRLSTLERVAAGHRITVSELVAVHQPLID